MDTGPQNYLPSKKNLEQIAKMFLIPNKWNFTKKLFVDDFENFLAKRKNFKV